MVRSGTTHANYTTSPTSEAESIYHQTIVKIITAFITILIGQAIKVYHVDRIVANYAIKVVTPPSPVLDPDSPTSANAF